jgi:acetyltransferase-like isoleucine patch superfamily enzyme
MNKESVERLYLELQTEKKEEYDRVLPIGELMVDRWKKAEFLGFGEGSSIYDSAIVMGRVSVGSDTWIGPNVLLDGTGGKLEIGSHCDISAGVQIYTHDTVKRCLTGGKHEIEAGNVKIGDNSYIAPMTIITRGVSIGKCCVVAAHSMVNKSFDDYTIIAGVPAKKIGHVQITDGNVELIYDK